ncbi:MAG TPA: hypothetical protein PLG21_09505 [Anaerolineae bacterium]|nr:hypothetical protein [Anaerolineae bacterium]
MSLPPRLALLVALLLALLAPAGCCGATNPSPLATPTINRGKTATPWPTPTCSTALVQSTTLQHGQAHTAYLDITYPVGQEELVRRFLCFAEDLYADVNGHFGGALPPTIAVQLTSGCHESRSQGGAIELCMHDKPGMAEAAFVHELAHEAMYQLTAGRIAWAENSRLLGFNEGVASWLDQAHGPALGVAEPQWPWPWAAYVYSRGLASLGDLEDWQGLADRVGTGLAYATARSFAERFIALYGWQGVMRTLEAIRDTPQPSLPSAMQAAGLDCDALLADWQAALATEAAACGADQAPRVEADLLVSSEGLTRDVSVRVRVKNGAPQLYRIAVYYNAGEGDQEVESASYYHGDAEDLVHVGWFRAGTELCWTAGAPWMLSESYRLVVISGWHCRTLE